MRQLIKQPQDGVTVIRDNVVMLDEVNTDQSRHARLGWIIVILGFGSFLTWAALAPLDKGVPVSGVVMVASNRQAIQHQVGGTIEQILVREGDVVKTGQVLVRMNDVQARASAEMSRVQYFTLRATEARLIAERDSKGAVTFPSELNEGRADPRIANNIALQSQLFTSRQAALRSELAVLQESVTGLRAQAAGLEESRDNKKAQQGFLKEQLENMRDLAKDGYVPRSRLLELEGVYAQLSSAISEDIGNIGRTRSQIAELNLRGLQRQQEYQREVRTQLADVQKEAEALYNRLKGQDFELSNTLVKAPVDGTVVGMNVFTNGGVISAGFRMMDLVPRDEPLIVEAMVPVTLIDKVRPELPVELIFSAFNQNVTPRVPAIVTQVSADRMLDERSGAPYYKMQARVAPEGMKLTSALDIRPGMPVELFVKTGERTLMNYLFKPLIDRASTALTEE